MNKIRATITGIAGALPDYILTNDEICKMVNTTDEWIMTRIGVSSRHILRDPDKGSSELGAEAVRKLLEKTNTKPEEIDMLICATVTPDMQFPATANIISDKLNIKNAFGYDMNAGCSGFLYGLSTCAKFVESGRYKKVVLVGAEKMSSIVNYHDRTTCPIFGDGAGAALLEPTTEDIGIIDEMLHSDGYGRVHLHMKAGGSQRPASIETVTNREHFIYQEGSQVFKWAVTKMADVAEQMIKKHNLTPETLAWLVPHQANTRIIEAVAKRAGIEMNKVMLNIQDHGNTTAATLPLCLCEWEPKLQKGDNIVLVTFGAGFTWGAIYLKWGYNRK